MAEYVCVAIADASYEYDKLYTYRVPPRLEGHIFVGAMVCVPFGRGSARPRLGVVLGEEEAKPSGRIKEVMDAAPAEEALGEEALMMVRYLKQATFCTWYEAVKTVVPRGGRYRVVKEEDGGWTLKTELQRPRETAYALAEGGLWEGRKPTEKQQAVLNFLAAGPHSRAEICEGCGVGASVPEGLAKKGLLHAFEREKAGEDEAVPLPPLAEGYRLNEDQQRVAGELKARMDGADARPALLYGVTGSGKTAVFLALAREALQRGKSCLVLVPEIGLAQQMIDRLREAFGPRVAVQHSALADGERFAQWQSVRRGRASVVVGTRSAVFAPLENIGLIVLDEEQERSYQSDASPRYDAIEVARRRAARHGALLLLASATPSVASYYAASQGRYTLHSLTRRYGELPLPAVEMADMHEEMLAGNPGAIGGRLALGITETLEAKKQVILLLNRRGYHRVGVCRACGEVLKCPDCSVPMIYHRGKKAAKAGGDAPAPLPPKAAEGEVDAFALWKQIAPGSEAAPPPEETDENGRLLCHYCGRAESPAPLLCPACGGEIRYTGFGTQRVEEELESRFPAARVLRMDMDSTRRKGSHQSMLRAFGRGEYDILLGTQMVAKGLDFDRVGLVGVIGIDSLLFSQGYRAFEHVFALVTQVVGRAGRAGEPGRAMIQTMDPENPVLTLAAKQDYPAFYEQEIAFRRFSLYPPFCGLCVAGFSAGEEADAIAGAKAFAGLLAKRAALQPPMPLRVLGPAPMHLAQIAGLWRWKLTIKCRADMAFRQLLGETLDAYYQAGWAKKAAVYIDQNPDAMH